MEQFLNDPSIYTLARGPLVWIAFLVFFIGMFYRIFYTIKGANSERVIYPYLSLRYSLRSIFVWLIPFLTISMRRHPWFTLITFVFHICAIATPLFLVGHMELWYESWGIRWFTLPVGLTDAMTVITITCLILLMFRRLLQKDLKFLSGSHDYVIFLIVTLPFLTAFFAHHELILDPKTMLTIHMITGEVMLISIPFTRLSHMFMFFLTRTHTGSEFGAIRRSRDF